jgi:hypothetical protein
MAQYRSEDSPTLPLPPPQAAPRITVDDLIEATAAAALRAVRAQQPANTELLYRPPIWCGIIIDPWGHGQLGPDPLTTTQGGARQE